MAFRYTIKQTKYDTQSNRQLQDTHITWRLDALDNRYDTMHRTIGSYKKNTVRVKVSLTNMYSVEFCIREVAKPIDNIKPPFTIGVEPENYTSENRDYKICFYSLSTRYTPFYFIMFVAGALLILVANFTNCVSDIYLYV